MTATNQQSDLSVARAPLKAALRRRPLAGRLFLLAPLFVACGGSTENPTREHDGGAGDAASGVLLPSASEAGQSTDGDRRADAATPDGMSVEPNGDGGVVAVPLFSCIPGEYVATGTLGASQTFQFAIDTGSTSMGVASSTCTSCAVAPEYTPDTSATDENQTASSQFGTGSWSGEVYKDSVSLGGSGVAPVDFVAIDSQSGFFTETACDSPTGALQGIIGFGPAASALPNTNAFFDQLVATRGIPNVFATMLCPTGGTLWLGGYDPAFTTAAPQYTTTTGSFLSPYYYAVDLVSMTVNGATAPIGTPQYTDSVVDTGTSIIIIPSTAFTTLTNAIGASPAFQTIFGKGGADAGNAASYFADTSNCVAVSQTKAELDAMLPPLTMVFGTAPAITVTAAPTESYLVEYEGRFCPGLDPMDPSEDYPLAALLGSPLLRSNVIIFDRANQRVGFAPHTACP